MVSKALGDYPESVYSKQFNEWLNQDPLIRVIFSHAHATDVIFDIGAFLGSYSIYLSATVNKSVVYAFEPNPSIYEQLLENIKTFNVGDSVIAKNIALSDEIRRKVFYVSSEAGRSSFNQSLAEINNCRIVKSIVVECFTVDHLVESGICRPPDIMKIDVEGHELEVLKGAALTIEKTTPKIFFEPHGNNRSKIEQFLSVFGYKFENLGYPVFCYVEK